MTRKAPSHIDELRGATRLAVEATRGVTALVEKMHVTIASGPTLLGRPLATPARLATRAVYATIQGITTLVGGSLDVALAQLTVGGTLDVGFGAGGTTITKLSATNWDEAQALVREPDGGLVVAGWVYEGGSSAGNFAVLRYGAAGALDARFGTGGTAIIPVAAGSKADQAMAVTVQPDDRVPTRRIVAAGWASDSNTDLAVIRVWQ